MINRFIGVVFGVVLLFQAVSCATPESVPTLDPAVIYTEAAQTVAAQLTADAPPTATPKPTPIPTNTLVLPTSTLLVERPTETTGGLDATPTSTPTQLPTATKTNSGDLIDEAELIVLYPPDDQVIFAGSPFSAQIGFRNTGPNTWTENYTFRYLSGHTFGAATKFLMDDYGNQDTVAPGGEVVFTIPGMTAPSEPGRYLSNWCFYNNREDQGLPPQCFYLITFQIIVE
ncbi:MAG: hypothetical protein HPY85_05550 [Anaerolineae bacterium]|nr:hypothetical protein [Anaerolineae bacterium]